MPAVRSGAGGASSLATCAAVTLHAPCAGPLWAVAVGAPPRQASRPSARRVRVENVRRCVFIMFQRMFGFGRPPATLSSGRLRLLALVAGGRGRVRALLLPGLLQLG